MPSRSWAWAVVASPPANRAVPATATAAIATTASSLTINIEDDAPVASAITQNIAVAPVDDTMVMSFDLDAGRSIDGIGGGHGMDELAQRHLGDGALGGDGGAREIRGEQFDLGPLLGRGRHEFLFICSVLPFVGGTGSPVAPVAVL